MLEEEDGREGRGDAFGGEVLIERLDGAAEADLEPPEARDDHAALNGVEVVGVGNDVGDFGRGWGVDAGDGGVDVVLHGVDWDEGP